MRKFAKLIAAAVAMTFIIATPVMAAEPNPTLEGLLAYQAMHKAKVEAQVNDLIVKAWGNPEGPQWSHHIAVVREQVEKLNHEEDVSYVNYLQDVVNNRKDVERLKKELVANCTELCKVNPGMAAQLATYQADYQNAVADRMNMEALLATAKTILNVQ